MWREAKLAFTDSLQSLECSVISAHPWIYGLGQPTENGAYMSPVNAITFLAQKLTGLGNATDIVIMMVVGKTHENFMANLNPLIEVFPAPTFTQVKRQAQAAAELAEGELIMANTEQESVIKSPRSRDPSVSVDVNMSIQGAAFIPFTAMPTDTAGKEIYKRALAGDYGEISLIPARDYYWSNGEWTAPKQEELTRSAEGRKSMLMQEASDAIAPLQDAVELDIATKEEKELYDNWRKYRVMLNRVYTSQTSNITWPIKPNQS